MWEWVAVGFLLLLGGVVGYMLGIRSSAQVKSSPATLQSERHRERSRAGTLEEDNRVLIEKNAELRDIVRDSKRVKDAAMVFARSMPEFAAPQFIDEGWFVSLQNSNELKAAENWATEASEIWAIIEELSPAAKRNLEESCVMALTRPDEFRDPVSTLLTRTIRAIREKPEGVLGNLFERRVDDFLHLAVWLGLVNAIGTHTYRSLQSLVVEAHKFSLRSWEGAYTPY
jgi:hypothetical protein